MSDSNAYLLVCIFFFLIGVFLVWAGYYGRRSYRQMVERDSGRTVGTLVEIRKQINYGGRGARVTHWMPVFRFTVNGTEYTQQNVIPMRDRNELEIGQTEELCYDPSDPRHFHRPGDDLDERLGRKMLWIGVIVIVVCVVFAAILCPFTDF